jgi:integrase
MVKLTDISVRNMRPGPERREIPDAGAAGLYLIVQPSGRRGFAVRYRFAGKPRKLTLPGGLSLAAARKLCGDAMLQVAQGIDPAVTKKLEKERAADAAKNTLRGVIAEYLSTPEARRLRTHGERQRMLTKLVYPSKLAGRPIHAISRRDVIELLDVIQGSSGARSADLVLSLLRRVFRWHALRNDSFHSPIVSGMSTYRYSEHARSRTLFDDELRRVWHAAGGAGVYGALLKFLLLTSARLREASDMAWAEVDAEGTWELPARRNKTGQPLTRPLPKAALDLLATLPRIDGCPYVFSADGVHALAGFSRRKDQFDALCGVSDWVTHDLRRTARSLLSRAGVSPDHAERVLGHVVGGVRGVYDRYAFHSEKKHALEALAAQVERIVNPNENIVALRG